MLTSLTACSLVAGSAVTREGVHLITAHPAILTRLGLDQVGQKYSLIRAVDSRHPQLTACVVQPVQVTSYPVDGQTYKTHTSAMVIYTHGLRLPYWCQARGQRGLSL